MNTVTLPTLTAQGVPVDTDPAAFGWLRDSNDALDDTAELRRRMELDGYLFLPGFLDRDEVAVVRGEIAAQFEAEGILDPACPVGEMVMREGLEMYFRPDISNGNTRLQSVIYSARMMEFYSRLLGEPAMHYDFTWFRAVGPGQGTHPHCDVVYMGRGAREVYTAWVPFGDVPLNVGGLVVLEGSHRNADLAEGYHQMDVDTACVNGSRESELNHAGFDGFGALDESVPKVRAKYEQRLLTSPEYRMGDLLTFSIYTVHGALDNQTQRIRISSDSRYQRASEPADERWIGENPPAHGGKMIRELIC